MDTKDFLLPEADETTHHGVLRDVKTSSDDAMSVAPKMIADEK